MGTTAWYYNGGSNSGDYANPNYGGNMLINGVQVPAGQNGGFTLNQAQLLEATNTAPVPRRDGLASTAPTVPPTASTLAISARCWPLAPS